MNLFQNSTVILALSLFATIPASAGLIANGDFEPTAQAAISTPGNGIPPFIPRPTDSPPVGPSRALPTTPPSSPV